MKPISRLLHKLSLQVTENRKCCNNGIAENGNFTTPLLSLPDFSRKIKGDSARRVQLRRRFPSQRGLMVSRRKASHVQLIGQMQIMKKRRANLLIQFQLNLDFIPFFHHVPKT